MEIDASTWAEKIGRNITKLRLSLGVNQTEFGRRMQVTKQRISQIEKGLFVPHPTTLNQVAIALGVNPADITQGTGTRPYMISRRGGPKIGSVMWNIENPEPGVLIVRRVMVIGYPQNGIEVEVVGPNLSRTGKKYVVPSRASLHYLFAHEKASRLVEGGVS